MLGSVVSKCRTTCMQYLKQSKGLEDLHLFKEKTCEMCSCWKRGDLFLKDKFLITEIKTYSVKL